ncbi:SDR family oxidoreductase [soil metagenome]
MRMESQSAIVTGASSGIGEAMARQLSAIGVKVGLTARRADRLERIASEIRDQGGTAAVAQADANDRSATREAIGRLTDELGPIDLLIVNAGRGGSTPAVGFSAEAFEQIVRVNLIGAAYAIEAVLPGMLERGQGHLVGISSMAGYRGLPGSTGYCSSKAGLSTLFEGLRVELRGRGIDVTVVHPGYVHTEMTSRFKTPLPWVMDSETAARIILRGVAARRRDVAFPWQTASLMGFMRLLPGAAYDRMVKRFMPR